MTLLSHIEGFYFVGIGGIGMSSLALYFAKGGFSVAGYDRSGSGITDSLEETGCSISFRDDPDTIPEIFRDVPKKDNFLVVYTPAISEENRILCFFRNNGYAIRKRSEILGAVSEKYDTIAVAGTHGKTTISTMTAHLLKQSAVDCSAFLGGVSKNYNSNLLTGESRYLVTEADEYDRSFHRLSPAVAVVTALDPDHLEVYGSLGSMISAYNEFCAKIRSGGLLLCNHRIRELLESPSSVKRFTYGSEKEADYCYSGIRHVEDSYLFNIDTPDGLIKDIRFPFPGIINIENLTAAVAVALSCGVTEPEIRKSALLFQGVRRRFDIRIDMPGLTYIDDYAHHPEEIKAFITSVREYFGNRKITAVFQPHLFTRTRDHAEGFAAMLDHLERVILLPVYPAREKPLPGVSSEMILERMKIKDKVLVEMTDIPGILDVKEIDVLVTIGAGDIDRLVMPIETKLKAEADRWAN